MKLLTNIEAVCHIWMRLARPAMDLTSRQIGTSIWDQVQTEIEHQVEDQVADQGWDLVRHQLNEELINETI